MAPNKVKLPATITGPVEFHRLKTEAENTIEELHQASLRQSGEATRLPTVSRLLRDVLEVNGLNILLPDHQAQLTAMLLALEKQAPTIHMSFTADPSPMFMQKLVTWLRQEIHPYVLVRIGLQPTIGAGCLLRTPNRYYDFSLRERFNKSKGLLIDKIRVKTEGSG